MPQIMTGRFGRLGPLISWIGTACRAALRGGLARTVATARGLREITRALGCSRRTMGEVRGRLCGGWDARRRARWGLSRSTGLHESRLGHPLKFVWTAFRACASKSTTSAIRSSCGKLRRVGLDICVKRITLLDHHLLLSSEPRWFRRKELGPTLGGAAGSYGLLPLRRDTHCAWTMTRETTYCDAVAPDRYCWAQSRP